MAKVKVFVQAYKYYNADADARATRLTTWTFVPAR